MIVAYRATGSTVPFWKALTRELCRLPFLEEVVLHEMDGVTLEPSAPERWGAVNIGYCFLSSPISAYGHMPAAARKWDHVIAASSWDESHLRIGGLARTSTVLPGVDALPCPPLAQPAPDGGFTVFTSGTFSFENGHDLVVAAMKAMMERYADVRLAYLWDYDQPALETLAGKGLAVPSGGAADFFTNLLELNGVDPQRCRTLAGRTPEDVCRLVSASNVGLFPLRSRREAGSRLLECLACGRPVVVQPRGPQSDDISADTSFELDGCLPAVTDDGSGVYFEPSLDDIMMQLERARGDRPLTARKGLAAAEALRRRPWRSAAAEIHRLAGDVARARRGSIALPPTVTGRKLRGVALMDAGCLDEAVAEFRESLALGPFDAETYNCLGNALDKQEQFTQALFCFDKAVALAPAFPAAWFNRGNTLKRLERFDEARESYETALRHDSTFLEAWLNLGFTWEKLDHPPQAEASYRSLLEREPDHPDALHFLGNLCYAQDRYDEARRCFERATELDPSLFLSWNSLGLALQAQGRHDEAIGAYAHSLRLKPDFTASLSNMGVACQSLRRHGEAITCFRRGMEIDPDYPDAHWNLSLSLLCLGEYEKGWREYEWRFRKDPPTFCGHTDVAAWEGESLGGRTILLHSEQGYGDTLQFVRYVPLVAERGGRVLVECQDTGLVRALETLRGVVSVHARGEALPAFDCQIPLLSLPLVMGTTIETVPLPGGYLAAPPERLAHWAELLRRVAPADRIRVGIVWGGRKTHLNADRSMCLDDLSPLLALTGVTFLSLQLGEDAAQIETLAPGIRRPVDLGPHISDFSDTAALVAQLDLVITIDTAVAHLAGALGRPVWVLLKFASDWRWGLSGSTTPWYASARLFRQESPGSWSSVAAAVADSLKKYFSGH